MDIIEKIVNRKSVRTYINEKVSDHDMELMEEIIDSADKIDTPFGTKISLKKYVIDKDNDDVAMPVPAYGLIKAAQMFIACACPNTRSALIDYGFIGEKAVLDITGIGLETCWVGALFNQKSLQKSIASSDEDIVPAIIVAGYPAQRNIKEKLIRLISKGDSRLAWEKLFYSENFDAELDESYMGIYKKPLAMLRLSPSASNKQPWRVVVSKDESECHFYIQKTPRYAGNKIGYEMQSIDMGIALLHFDHTCIKEGIQGYFKSEDPGMKDAKGREYIISWKRGEV